MEHGMKDIISGFGIDALPEQVEILEQYAHMLFEQNDKHNMTGLKSIDDVRRILIGKSAEPLLGFNVPRGTRFADVGTGSGMPGVVISVLFPHVEGVLIDSNCKKTDFIAESAAALGIKNIKVINGRIEELGRDPGLRGCFDWCFTRAFGPLYYSIEFGLPLLKENAYMYVYSTLRAEKLSRDMIQHISGAGGVTVPTLEIMTVSGLQNEGILIKKNKANVDKYPRRFAVVKREAVKVSEEE